MWHDFLPGQDFWERGMLIKKETDTLFHVLLCERVEDVYDFADYFVDIAAPWIDLEEIADWQNCSLSEFNAQDEIERAGIIAQYYCSDKYMLVYEHLYSDTKEIEKYIKAVVGEEEVS